MQWRRVPAGPEVTCCVEVLDLPGDQLGEESQQSFKCRCLIGKVFTGVFEFFECPLRETAGSRGFSRKG